MERNYPTNMAKCAECGQLFTPREPHHKRCSDCQRKAPTGRSGPTGAPSAGGPPAPRGLPENYLKDGYFDQAGNVRPELLTSWAETLARLFVQEAIAYGQLRRAFGKVRSVERRLDGGARYDEVVADVWGLCKDAAYAVGREVAPQAFKRFVDQNVALAAQDERSFRKGFLKHFESIIGYYVYHAPKQQRR